MWMRTPYISHVRILSSITCRWLMVVMIPTVGTTRATAGSAGAFERIDREYVVAGAQAALQNAADARAKQSLVYLSSTGATSGSPFLYPKSKGLTEEALCTSS